MKEITTKSVKAFIASGNIPFIATQYKMCIPIMFRMCQKMSHGIKFDAIKIADNLIIDGHHRYLSALMMEVELGMVRSNTTSATKSIAWNEVEFDEQDWDTPAKIAHLNELDALYNNLEVAFVKQMTLG